MIRFKMSRSNWLKGALGIGLAANCCMAADLRLIGIERPADLRGKDAFILYRQLCEKTGQRHDPCVLDTFMAATDFMRGAPAAPWWKYTAERKATFGTV